MHYLDEGPRDAPPVLMLHGNPTWSFYYRNLVIALRGQFRCIVPDHLGCGLSDKPDDEPYDYRLKSRIEDIDTPAQTPGPEQPADPGGARLGRNDRFRLGGEHPDQVSKMVVLNTAAFPLPEDKKMPPALSLVRDTALGASWSRVSTPFPASPPGSLSRNRFPRKSGRLTRCLMTHRKTASPRCDSFRISRSAKTTRVTIF